MLEPLLRMVGQNRRCWKLVSRSLQTVLRYLLALIVSQELHQGILVAPLQRVQKSQCTCICISARPA